MRDEIRGIRELEDVELKMTRIRIGNVEYRETVRLDGNGTYEEIVRWFPNRHYGKRKSMLEDGYRENPDGSVTKGQTTVGRSCFDSPESCCSIAQIVWNRAHDEFDVMSVGLRAFELDGEDKENLMRTLKMIGETNG